MDLFRDIKKGKFGNNPKLKREASHELKELGGEKKAEAYEKKVKMAGKMNIHQKHSLLHYTQTKDKAGADAWVRKAKAGKIMRIM